MREEQGVDPLQQQPAHAGHQGWLLGHTTPPTMEIFFKAFSQLEQRSVVSTCVLYEI